MAKKQEAKAEVEREYNVPLRKGWLRVPKYKRAKKAVKTLKEFLARHLKSDNVKVGKYANLKIWEKGIKNPPHHIKVKVIKNSEGRVDAEIIGAPEEKPKEEKKEKKEAKPEAPKKEGEKTEGVKGEEKPKEDKAEEKAPSKTKEKEAATAPKEKNSEEKK